MKSLRLRLALLVSAMSVAGIAHAQSVRLNQFRPAETAEDGMTLSRPDDRGHMQLGAFLAVDFGLRPLVFQPTGGSSGEIAIVRNQLDAHLGVSLGLVDRVVVFAGLPVDLVQSGSTPPGGAPYGGADGAGVGDLSFGARVRLFGENDALFGLALQVGATLPTARWANGSMNYAGEHGVTLTPELLAELRLGRGFRVTANAGARLRLAEESAFQTLPIGQEFTWGLGTTLPILRTSDTRAVGLSALLELYGANTFDHFGKMGTSPIEALAGLRVEPRCGLFVNGAAGTGLTRGYGSPDFRAMISLGWSASGCPEDRPTEPTPTESTPAASEPTPGPNDTDGDGIVDTLDRCPTDPEDRDGFQDEDGCPDLDNDEDGKLDGADACPNDPEDRDAFDDEDGCPDLDNDQDGFADPADGCPLQPEDRDGFQDEDGCPDVDNDQDGLADPADQCPLAPGRREDQGCPRTIRLDVETGTIVVLSRVEFATGRDTILARSFPILDEVRAVLESNRQLRHIRIEGYTDDRGSDPRNLELSRRRAQSVVRRLVEGGVDPGRLMPFGCGETNPIDSNRTNPGRQANRRVEFHIVDPAPPGTPRHIEGCVESSH